MRNYKPILLVDDDDVDAIITQRAVNELKITNELVRKVDGEDALNYLRDEGNPKPCVILLDLNMPRMNGFEFLKVIKNDSELKRLPIVVLTTSDVDQNILDSFDLGVAGYIVKPVDYKQFVEAMKTINMYWTLSQLPTETGNSAALNPQTQNA
ncbi:MAG: two-component system response regulator [Planctomycetes bacterium GWF2_41_51]|nr:MAG: two-component system response regulator [Planctomycetes bacterium GWF2_41_51]HBG27040.1 two-component system response regulator [Phycisphaerales bacterium]